MHLYCYHFKSVCPSEVGNADYFTLVQCLGEILNIQLGKTFSLLKKLFFTFCFSICGTADALCM